MSKLHPRKLLPLIGPLRPHMLPRRNVCFCHRFVRLCPVPLRRRLLSKLHGNSQLRLHQHCRLRHVPVPSGVLLRSKHMCPGAPRIFQYLQRQQLLRILEPEAALPTRHVLQERWCCVQQYLSCVSYGCILPPGCLPIQSMRGRHIQPVSRRINVCPLSVRPIQRRGCSSMLCMPTR